ncbi:MAG: adenylate/guanylate cyclase domain-containing protein [Actinobacteria bacterium]|nr:MAG: adenylate/guanylate cyclase domain-containing protein [Actinomycetota bacterium]
MWPLVADTDRFNRDTGVPPVEVLGTEANARRRLRLRRLGVPIEWEEEPFEWVRPHRFGVVRRYARGPIVELRVEARLEERDDAGTSLDYDVRVRPRNLLGLLAAAVQIGLVSRSRFARTFRTYDSLATTSEPAQPARLASGGGDRLRRGGEKLREQGVDPRLVAALVVLLERGDEQALARLRPYELADAWQAGRRESLELLLHSTRIGLTELRWELLCPSCRGPAATVGSLRDLDTGVHCETCGIDVSADLDRSVEVTFTPSPSVRAVDRREFCVGGPQLSPHVVAQQLLGPAEERRLTVRLRPGTYRVRALGEAGGDVFEATGETVVTLANDSESERLLRLERTEWRDRAATAAEVTSLQAFRDLFSTEVLRPGEPVSVGTLTVLFTDLRDSTRFYREVGDAPAFGSVMQHLDVLREAVASEGGAVVKAMGDAIMAVFTHPAAAVRAGLAAQRAVAGRPLELKVGVHTGPCIAITQNGALDYFGSTVNLAARLVSLSTGADVVVSGEVLADPEVEELALRREPLAATLKGFEESLELWRVR